MSKRPLEEVNSTEPPSSETPPTVRYVCTNTLTGHKKAVSAVKISADGKWMLSTSADMTVRIWSTATWKCTHVLQGHTQGVNDASFSADSNYVASASDDRTIRLWKVSDGKMLSTMRGHANFVFCVAFSPQGNMLASGSFDESLRIWCVKTSKCLKILPAHSDPVSGVHFSCDGTLIVSGSYDGLCRIWDTATGQCLKTLIDDDNPPVSFVKVRTEAHRGAQRRGARERPPRRADWHATPATDCSRAAPLALAPTRKRARAHPVHGMRVLIMMVVSLRAQFSPNGRFILAGLLDNTLRLWNYTKGKCLRTYAGHRNSKFCCFADFVTVGAAHLILAGSEDGKAYLWDLQTKQLVQSLEGHENTVLGVAAHPTRELVATGGTDKDLRSIRIWENELREAHTDKAPKKETSAASAGAPAPPAPIS